MLVNVLAQVGTAASPTPLTPPLALLPSAFDAVHSWAGSYDVLDLPGHFQAYHSPMRRPIRLYAVAPPCGFFGPLKHKLQSGEINGNFGETLPAIFALERLGLGPGRVIHLRRNSTASGKSPDFLFRLGSSITAQVAASSKWASLGLPAAIPDWWPVECKATSGSYSSPWLKAIKQLIHFWYEERHNLALEPGFGVVSIFSHRSPALDLLWRFVVPQPGQAALIRPALIAATNAAAAETAIRPMLKL